MCDLAPVKLTHTNYFKNPVIWGYVLLPLGL